MTKPAPLKKCKNKISFTEKAGGFKNTISGLPCGSYLFHAKNNRIKVLCKRCKRLEKFADVVQEQRK